MGGLSWRNATPCSTGRTRGNTIVIPATAGIHDGGPAMGSRLHGNDGRRRRTHKRRRAAGAPTFVIPAMAGIHDGGPAMGSRLHGNDGRRRRTHKRRRAAGAPTFVIPATAGIRDGGPAMGSRLHGNDGRRRRTHKRRRAAGAPTFVIPATAGIHDGGPAMGSRLHGNDGRRRRTHKRRAAAGASTIVIPATAGIHGGGPAMGSRLHGNDGRRRRTHKRREAAGDPTNDGRRRAIPQTTVGGGRSHNRHSRDGGNPQRGAGDGFPSPRELREAAAHPHSTGGGGAPTFVIPATAGIHDGGPAMGSRLHGNYGRRRRTHKRRRAAGAPTFVRGREKHSSPQL